MEKRKLTKNEIIFKYAPCIILLLDKNKNIIEVNEKIKEFGYSTEELKGKSIFKLLLFNENVEKIFEKEEIFKIEIFTRKGEKKIGLAELKEVEEEGIQYILIIHDITEEELLKIKLKEEEETLKEWYNFAENSLSGIYIFDKNFNFLYVNPSLCKILNMKKEEVMEKKVYELIHPSDIPLVEKEVKKGFSGEIESANLAIRLINKNGKIKYVKVSGRVAKFNGKEVIMGAIVDITEIKEYEEKIKKEHRLLKKTFEGIIYSIIKIVETRDPYTVGHQLKVTKLAEAIAKEMRISNIKEMIWASLLHDIGKITIPSEILVTPRKLTQLEFNIMKTHPTTGYNIVKIIPNFEKIAKIILQHHERLDGSGYPEGIKRNKILKEAKILGVSDVVEAMVSNRPYRPALPLEAALEEIYRNKGIKYEEDVVEICIDLFENKKFNFE